MPWLTWIVLALAVPIAYAGIQSERKGKSGTVEEENVNTSGPIPPTTAKKTTNETEIDCTERHNGKYALGCSNWFIRCDNHTSYKFYCPAQLMFDPLMGHCDYESRIKHCAKKNLYQGQIIETPSEFSCANRSDGLYAHPEIPCSSYYHTCIHGKAARTPCPANLYFDERLKRCDYQQRVPACKNENKDGVIVSAILPNGSLAQQKPLRPAPSTLLNPEITNATLVSVRGTDARPHCENNGDGVYHDILEICSRVFWKCANNKLFKYECNKGLIYDKVAMRCAIKEFVPNCGGVRQQADTHVETPHIGFQGNMIRENETESTSNFDCSNKNDGQYEIALCQNTFVQCAEGKPLTSSCTAGLVYNGVNRRCDYEENCKKAAEQKMRNEMGDDAAEASARGRLIGDAEIPAGTPVVSSAAIPVNSISLPIAFDRSSYFENVNVNWGSFCDGQQTGKRYGQGCNKYFFYCGQNSTRLILCPPGLFYNPSITSCDTRDNNEACDQLPKFYDAPGTVDILDAKTLTTPSSMHSSSLVTTASPIETNFTCDGKENGYKSNGCSFVYYHCSRGRVIPLSCGSTLIRFDERRIVCDFPHRVEECGGTPEASTSASALDVTTGDSISTTAAAPAPAPNIPRRNLATHCTGKSDGLLAIGDCSPEYLTCASGSAFSSSRCQNGLVFNRARQICDYPSNVAGCPQKVVPPPSMSSAVSAPPPSHEVKGTISTGNNE